MGDLIDLTSDDFPECETCREPTRRAVGKTFDIDLGEDVVLVVRCKDCKNKGMCCHHNGRYVGQFNDDDYCSYGERRGEHGNAERGTPLRSL